MILGILDSAEKKQNSLQTAREIGTLEARERMPSWRQTFHECLIIFSLASVCFATHLSTRCVNSNYKVPPGRTRASSIARVEIAMSILCMFNVMHI